MERHAYRDDRQRITRWEYIVIENPQNNCKKVYQTPVIPENSLLSQNRQVEKVKVKNGGLLKTDLNKKTTTDSPLVPQLPLSSPDDQKKKNPIGNKKISDKKTTADKAELQSLSLSPEQYKTEHDTLISLIPESMRQPAIINLVDKYHRSQGFEHVADSIVYTNQRPQRESNGTWQAYRGYLSKGLAGHYEGISGLYASADSKEDKKKSGRQEILESIVFNRKKFLILNDGRRYEIDEGFVPGFEFVSKDTEKTQKMHSDTKSGCGYSAWPAEPYWNRVK